MLCLNLHLRAPLHQKRLGTNSTSQPHQSFFSNITHLQHTNLRGLSTSRHVTSRLDSTRLDSTQTFPGHPADRPAFLFSAVYLFRRRSPPPNRTRASRSQPLPLTPHKKVCCRHSWVFFFPGKFCLLFPFCSPTEPSPAARPAAALIPNACWNRTMQASRAPCSCELGVRVCCEAERARLRPRSSWLREEKKKEGNIRQDTGRLTGT